MLAGFEARDALLEVVEGDGEVPRVAAGRFEAEASCPQVTDAHEGENLEASSGACCASSSTVASRAANTEMPYSP